MYRRLLSLLCPGLVFLVSACGDAGAPYDAGTPYDTGQFTDARDGKTYTTITLGTQTWMSQNLAYENSYGWVYDDDAAANLATYGYLYDYEQALTACPVGWHLPSQAEWEALFDFLGGEEVAGGMLKEAGGALWNEPNQGADEAVGFNAIPGGARYNAGNFVNLGDRGTYWSSTNDDMTYAYYVSIDHDDTAVSPNTYYQSYAFSVRCIED